MSKTPNRGRWSSRLGFILAASGSAIGLGNIWRFPYTAGENGGGAFVLIYLAFVLLIGIPVLLAELAVGRHTHRNPVGAFRAICPGSLWPVVGGLGVLTGFGILAFYSVVAGWTLGYVVKAATGTFSASLTTEQSSAIFQSLVASPSNSILNPILLSGLFLLLTALVVQRGVSKGIETASRILMPIFFILLVVLAGHALSLDGASAGLSFLFKPDFSKITATVVVSALGQALFSLSLGMGAMITYGSYLPEDEDLSSAGIIVALFDTAIAILAGLIIFPALFHAGAVPDAGPGLVFKVMPTIFNTLPAGSLFGFAFYCLLAIAALTSTISLLEVIVAYFVDERGWSRRRATWVMAGSCFVLAIPSALSAGANSSLTNMAGGQGFLGLQSIVWGNYSLSIGALLICIFVGWVWGVPKALAEVRHGGADLPGAAIWGTLVRYVCPVAVAVVLSYIIWTGQYF